MPIKKVNIFRDAPTDSKIERRRMLAERLRQASQARPFEGYQGRIVPKYTLGHALAQIGTAGLGAYTQRKADDAEARQEAEQDAEIRRRFGLRPSNRDDAKRQMMANTLQGNNAQPQSSMPTLGMSPALAYEFYKMDPQGYMRAVAESKQQRGPISVSQGETLLDPNTMKPVYQSPAKPNIGALDAAKYTAQSVERFQTSGDYGVLIPQSSDGRNLKDILGTESGLRKEFTSISEDYRELAQKYTNIQTAAQNPSAAGDLSIVFSFMKILDPTSVVREGEQATARNAAGVPEQLRNVWNRLQTGEQLTPAQRADFVGQAESLFQARQQEQSQLIKQYTDIATRAGVNVQNVVLDAFRPSDSSGWKVKEIP